MKKTLAIVLLSCALSALQTFGQLAGPRPSASSNESASTNLVRFDLDFPGGTPSDLVDAIQKQSGRPLNAIIPDECLDEKLPALKMRSITVAELFQALGLATTKEIPDPSGPIGFRQFHLSATFKTEGLITPDSIWFFRADKPVVLPKASPQQVCRFYQLAGFLEHQTVDDIITVVETGWKMMNDGTPNPNLKFHKETKLLIAVGVENKLKVIEDVLMGLKPVGIPNRTPPPTAGPIPTKQ
ncbi:MAG: hypothetical protein JNN07_19395 [Verrucomicrobiales bacterium]|nr:hypothetical protein [Verrucomicrobiales bacterium]